MKYIESIKEKLTDDNRDVLKHIYKPVVVAVPLSDSRRDIYACCLMAKYVLMV